MDVNESHIVFAYSELDDPFETIPEQLKDIKKAAWKLFRQLFDKAGTKILSGPFAGVELSQEEAWNDGNTASKLFGIYEIELHPHIEKAISRKPKTVINIGCAEGYYTSGFAKRLPDAKIKGYDLLPEALKLASANAEKNGLTNTTFWLVDGEYYDFVDIAEILFPADLVIMDAESGEQAYLNKVLQPLFSRFDLIVECHDFLAPGTSKDLVSRLQGTHTVEVIKPMENPVRRRLPQFDLMGQTMPAVTVRDFHSEETIWLACWSKDRD